MDLILMASGFGKRFGKNKLMEILHGKRVFAYAAQTFFEAKSIRHRIVVSQYQEILDEMAKLGYIAVRNERAYLGVSESIRLGMQRRSELLNDGDGILFAVCDQPLLRAQTVEGMIASFRKIKKESPNVRPILCASFADRRGNPVIFDDAYSEELLNLTGDMGGRQVLKKHEDALWTYEVANQRELMDIDTCSDLQEIVHLGEADDEGYVSTDFGVSAKE